MSADAGLEEVLLTVRETFLYRIPPMQSATGHYCKSWKLEAPLKTTQLQVLSQGTSMFLRFLLMNGSLYAESIVVDIAEHGHKATDKLIAPCSDSSRYFVTFIVNKKAKRRVALGFGFRERPTAFDLQAAVADCQRRVCRLLGKKDENEGLDAEEGAMLNLSAGVEVAGFVDEEGGGDEKSARQGEPNEEDSFDFGPLAEVVPASTPPPLGQLALAGPPEDVCDGEGGKKKKKKKKKKDKKKKKKESAEDGSGSGEEGAAEWGDFADAPVAAAPGNDDDVEWGDFS